MRIGGISWLVLKYLFDSGRLEVFLEDFSALLRKSPVLLQNPSVILTTLATVQTVAGFPQIREVVDRWAAAIPGPSGRDISSLGFGESLEPWKSDSMWDFETWAAIVEVVPRVLALELQVTEEFLSELRSDASLTPGKPGELEVMVATMFIIRNAPWFWPFLG